MFKRIYFFFFTYLAAVVYSQTLMMLWFLEKGVSYTEMLFYFLIMHLLPLPLCFILEGKKFSSRSSLFLGVFASVAGVMVAGFMTHTYHIFIAALIFGFNLLFLWMVYNILHFKYSTRDENGFKSGAYFLLTPVLSVILAPLSGLVVEKFGYHFLFLSSLLFYIIPFALIFYLPGIDFEFNTRKALSNMEHPLLIFLQGYTYSLSFNVIPIVTLFFVSTPLRLGNFFGYLAIFAAFAALLNSRVSDRLKKRSHFFYIFSGLNVLSYIPLFLSGSFVNWQIFSGINNLTYGLVKPFDFALILDHAKLDIGDTMLGREFYLNLGRSAMLVFALVVYYLTSSLWTALLLSALVPLLYPVVAYYQGLYLKK